MQHGPAIDGIAVTHGAPALGLAQLPQQIAKGRRAVLGRAGKNARGGKIGQGKPGAAEILQTPDGQAQARQMIDALRA